VRFKGNNPEPVVLIETKDSASGLDYAPEKAQFSDCQVDLVTKGYCHKTYLRDREHAFSTTPSGRLKIMKPRDLYLLEPEGVAGALGVLKWLMLTTVTLRRCGED
jgi:hypothetical protein